MQTRPNPLDLFKLAQSNSSNLETEFNSISAPLSRKNPIKDFELHIRTHRHLAINMRLSVVLSLLKASKHHNIYEWAEARSKHSGIPRDQILQKKLGPYYEKRIAFDTAFTDGPNFRYATLNTGGLGAMYYGEFCVISKRDFPHNKENIAFVKSDSLKTYLLPNLSINTTLITQESADDAHCSHLATIKHHTQAPSEPEEQWPAMLYKDGNFIEAIFTTPLTTDDIQLIRMPKSDHEVYFNYAFNDINSKLSESEKTLVENFVLVLEWLGEKKIPLEVQ